MEIPNEEISILQHERGLRKERGLPLSERQRTQEENRDFRDRTFNSQRHQDLRLLNPPSVESEIFEEEF